VNPVLDLSRKMAAWHKLMDKSPNNLVTEEEFFQLVNPKRHTRRLSRADPEQNPPVGPRD